ncbi:type 1 glutamine amidotransferase domain-containing protein [Marivirga sp. S37H4]|uniref:Type 1 glutamine amidotransferase domain-containing protein n=1 Tax=Marivirga aurantiaca TaxID=2802615 RepID=A0A934X071_9BACT|nr:type 1 glutamine amidotransferase domain-containing protein [Marivirga aurantiaca]MBK6266062.1 type 1 glutamine amidotransferase domain-containing protein [Marivirga aurantiaca]
MQKLTFYFLMIFFLASCSKKDTNEKKILIVTSNQHTYGDTQISTSNHFAEIVLAYDVFIKNGYSVDFISPLGGAIPIGYISTSDSIQKKYLYNNELMNKLKYTKSPNNINPFEYKAIYYSGGGAAMFGVAENKKIKSIAESIYKQNGIVSAVCHGTAGIINLKDEQGNSLYQNRNISGYPDLFENKEAEYYRTFPFSIEEKIRENNGNFMHSEKQRDNFYVIDGNFITGQDPSATTSVAKKVIEAIENQQ